MSYSGYSVSPKNAFKLTDDEIGQLYDAFIRKFVDPNAICFRVYHPTPPDIFGENVVRDGVTADANFMFAYLIAKMVAN